VIPDQFANFLLGSAGASAALIGLLFVSVSLAPERVFGQQAHVERQTGALSAFTALANAFFISLGGLVPGLNIGALAAVAALVALGQTLSLLALWPRWRRERRAGRPLLVGAVSAGIYGYELWIALRLVHTPGDSRALSALCGLLLGPYVIGLGRAWRLLGAPQERGLWAALRAEVRGTAGAEGSARGAPAAPEAAGTVAPAEAEGAPERQDT
jgi:hypothetical protein